MQLHYFESNKSNQYERKWKNERTILKFCLSVELDINYHVLSDNQKKKKN